MIESIHIYAYHVLADFQVAIMYRIMRRDSIYTIDAQATPKNGIDGGIIQIGGDFTNPSIAFMEVLKDIRHREVNTMKHQDLEFNFDDSVYKDKIEEILRLFAMARINNFSIDVYGNTQKYKVDERTLNDQTQLMMDIIKANYSSLPHEYNEIRMEELMMREKEIHKSLN